MKQIQVKKIVDNIVEKTLFFTALLSASFIILVIVVIFERGISPFISDNDGLGPVNLSLIHI